MRGALVSIAVASAVAGCALEPAATTAPRVPAAPPARGGALAPRADALALIEQSPTLDGPPIGHAADTATVLVLFASWCGHCRDQLAAIDAVRAAHPAVRIIGVNYRAHEEYERRGDAVRVRDYVAANAPWLIVVPVDDPLWAALGRPPKIPTLYVYDRAGALVRVYDRRVDPLPTAGELDALLARLGA
jgi:thiol-disulfide isomerase/thioredoxin